MLHRDRIEGMDIVTGSYWEDGRGDDMKWLVDDGYNEKAGIYVWINKRESIL